MRMRGDKLRRIKCWITGGHKFKPLDMAVKYVRSRDEFVFWRECTKCGKVYFDAIPAEWIRRATDRAIGSGKSINFSTYIDSDGLEAYDIPVWNGREIKFDKDK